MSESRPHLTDAAADALVGRGLDLLFEVDHDLPACINEATVSGRFAGHLAHAMTAQADLAEAGWNVDTEYNCCGEDDPKTIPQLRDMLASLAHQLGWPANTFVGSRTGRVRPDVIVHHRKSGRTNGNLIACELKRIDASKQVIAADLVKLAGYRNYLEYEHAFLILLGDTRDECVVHRASTSIQEVAWYVQHLDEAAALRRRKRGYEKATKRQHSLLAAEGAQPTLAVAESLSALNALEAMGMWPAPRDASSEQGIQQVRRRWARVQHRAQQARTR